MIILILGMEGDVPKIKAGKAVCGAFVTALLMKVFLFDFTLTEGESMIPAIEPGALLVVNKAVYGLRLPGSGPYLLRWALPKEGEVVVFYTPSGDKAVKRCARINGDRTFLALGDNGEASYDSRSYGPVSIDRIVGKVWGVK